MRLASAVQTRISGLAIYCLLSAFFSVLLFIDPLLNAPSGLIKLSSFTRRPVSHGLDPCSWDYEGSWRVGLAHAAPDPLHLNISSDPVLTCATLANMTPVSFVADPFLFIPSANLTFHVTTAALSPQWLSANSSSTQPWFAFFEMKNLRRYIGELGVAVSFDHGNHWTHLGTALAESFHLSYPLVLYDAPSKRFLMLPETSGAADGSIRIYATSQEAFPFGWKLLSSRRPWDGGWPATRRWFQFRAPARYVDTSPVWFQNQWWIFTTRVGVPSAGQPKYTLLLYTAKGSLLDEWTPHPTTFSGASFPPARSGHVPFGIDVDRRTARSGGRPFVHSGVLYRWAQDCSGVYGGALVLMRADVANSTSYKERAVTRYEPTHDGRSWRSARLHHADMQQLPDGSWVGLLDGDRYPDGYAHFIARERWFVDLKATLRYLVPLQLAAVILAVLLIRVPFNMPRFRSFLSGYDAGGRRVWCFPAMQLMWTRGHGKAPGLPTVAGGGSGSGPGCGSSLLERNVKSVVVLVATAVGVSVGIMAFAPWLVVCPRWPIHVHPLPSSEHFVPERPYVDPGAPYNVSDLAVVTGCSSTFVDRLENMVASVQHWAPSTRLVVYDLGFTSEQLAKIRCWSGIELLRFPWERYPPHVRELSTYAFKPIAFALALDTLGVETMLWLDCGLELRGPLAPIASALSARGHVSAQQSTSPGRQGHPPGHLAAKYTAPFLNISLPEFERIKNQPFCAGGFQGYVRGSAADRLLLRPVVSCALHPEQCLAPPGHSRAQHCYDQTAFTLLIRHHNFSSCLPRELFCTSSTRKTSYDPRQSSEPVVVTSRRYRKPQPYRSLLKLRPGCVADPASNPWPTIASEHTETTISRASLKAMALSYAGVIPEYVVQFGSCLGLHVLIQMVLWGQVLLSVLGCSMGALLRRGLAPRHGSISTGQLRPAHASPSGALLPPLPLIIGASLLMAATSVLAMAVLGNVS